MSAPIHDTEALERWLSTDAPLHTDYPHEPGRLIGCPACEARCHCSNDPGETKCVWDPKPDAMPNAHRFSRSWLEQLGAAVNELGFTTFTVQPDGMLGPRDHRAPEVYHSESNDVEICDMKGQRWHAITGMTGQHGYDGAVMHSSECIGSSIAEVLMYRSTDEAQTFAVAIVEDLNDPDDPAGWCILHYVGDTGE